MPFPRRLSPPFFILFCVVWLAGAIAPLQGQFLILARDDDTVTELQSGSSLTLNSEGVGAAVRSTINVRFEGPDNSTATVSEPELTGSRTFEVVAERELPHLLTSGSGIDFNVTFTPTGVGPFSARLILKLQQNDPGRPARTSEILINLNGQAADYTLSFEFLGGNETLLPADGVLPFPETEQGSSSTATIIVTNRGSGPGTMTGVELTGDSAFGVTGLQLLPAVIDAGRDLRFSAVFTPTGAQAFGGSLRITFGAGSRSIQLTGNEAGASLRYETLSGAVTPGQTITLGLGDAGEENAVVFRVANSATTESILSSISVDGSEFSLSGLPIFPFTLGPGQTITFRLTFDPAGPGTVAGELRINAATFLLSGEVPPLPAVTIAVPDGDVAPAEQIALGVSLSEPYPGGLVGDLSLSFTPTAFSDDPAIQFSTGGRIASFLIRAGETQAEFGAGGEQVLLQTGTAAGAIAVEAFFETDGTAVDVTPATLPSVSLTVQPAAPVLRDFQISSFSQGSLALQITGFATSRAVSNLEFQFTGAPGSQLTTSSLQANVENAFNTWYQSAQSGNFGSQFTATVNLVVDGDVNAIQSISVRATNQQGSSEPAVATIN